MEITLIAFACIVLDFVTGLLKAFSTKSFTSGIMREGLYNKAGQIILVTVACLLDFGQTYIDLGFTIPLLPTICTYIIIMECGSMIENLGTINNKIVPPKLKQYFTKLKEENEGD